MWCETVGWLLPRGASSSHEQILDSGGNQGEQPQPHRIRQRAQKLGELGSVGLL